MIRRITAELTDGRRLVVSLEPPPDIVDADGETTGVHIIQGREEPRPLARCAPEPRLTTRARMRGHLRALPRVA